MRTDQIKKAEYFFNIVLNKLKSGGIDTKEYEEKWYVLTEQKKIEWLEAQLIN